MAVVSDPVRLAVIKNALEGIADGMALTLIRTSRSSVVRQTLDFSTGVLDPSGHLVGQGLCQAIHLGGMPPALRSCTLRYQDRIEPGDIFISNDPYEGASHLPDIFLYKPVFVGDVLAAYVCAMSHHTDIGGRVAGGNACDSTEIYQEGLRIPPLKLYQRGQPNETLFRILEKAVRVPEQVVGDLMGNIAALHYGEREYMKLVSQHGVEDLLSYQEELLDYTEWLARRGIRALPDGQWRFTDYIDEDGITPDTIAIAVTLTKQDDQIHVDFTGTSPQCKGAIQPVFETTKAMVYGVVRTMLGGDLPNTSGYFRPVKVTAPEGCFVNPLPPAPVAARGLGCMRITHALWGAFAQMLPDKVMAGTGGCELGISMGGYHRDVTPWKPWILVEFHNEQARGGFAHQDGADAQPGGLSNLANLPVEVLEAEHPIRVKQYGLTPDSEGAGRYRGGLGMVREYRYLKDETLIQVRSDRSKHPPYGLYGGQQASRTRLVVNPGAGERVMPSKFLVTLNKGDELRIEWSGAGGWGNPLERDPELVLQDVIAEKISPRRAREVYGVAVDVGKRRVNLGDTARLRRELAQPDEQGAG